MKIQAEIKVTAKIGQDPLFALISLHLQDFMHLFKRKLRINCVCTFSLRDLMDDRTAIDNQAGGIGGGRSCFLVILSHISNSRCQVCGGE